MTDRKVIYYPNQMSPVNIKRRIFLSILLVLLILAAAGISYLNKVYLPVKIKAKLTGSLEEALHYNVNIDRVSFSLINGIVIRDILVYDKIKTEENTILKIKRVSFHLLYLPLIRDKRLIIPVLHIYSPELKLSYNKDSIFNSSELLSAREGRDTAPKNKYQLLAYKINILKGSLLFEDERQQPKFSKAIHNLNMAVSVRNLKTASFVIHGDFLSEKEGPPKIFLQGDYIFSSKELKAKLNLTNLSLAELNPYLKTLPFLLSSGIIKNTNLTFKLQDKSLEIGGIISLKGAVIEKEGLLLSADMDILPQLNYTTDRKTLRYKLGLKLNNAELQGIEYIGKVSDIKGDLELAQDKLKTNNLEFQALGSNFKLSGLLENFTSPALTLDLESQRLKLEELFILISPPQDLKLSGIAIVKVKLKRTLEERPLDIEAALAIEDARFEAAFLKEALQHIKGTVNFKNDTASWEGLSFNYLETPYATTGTLVGFKDPRLNLKIDSKDLRLASDIKISPDLIKLNTFLLNYINSDCAIKGAIHRQEKNNPLLDLALALNVNPQDILVFLPKQLAENIKKINPQGNIKLSGSLSGKAMDYKDWEIQAQGSSEFISLYNLKFNNLSFALLEKDKILNLSGLSASGYSGTVNLDFLSNFTQDKPSYALKLKSSGIDLGELKSDIGLKGKDIAGIIDISANLVGDFQDSASLKGNGLLSLQNGRLWQINLLKGLGEVFLLPDYQKIVFKEATAEFNIENKAISTDDLRLISDQLKLNCEGRLGFDGGLDFVAYAQVNKELISESTDLRKFTAAILGELGNAVSVKISGTIQKPKYRLVPMPLDLLKRVKDFFLGK
ncbi:MAG: DUF748 domain-containing protein [Candidatus Omnitrophica bacterium]|nr:DUF748 domain-containing protein [Candidatus Omnitrophota bacterium]